MPSALRRKSNGATWRRSALTGWVGECPAFEPATVLALLDRIEALEAENERLRKIEAAARTLVDTAFELTGHDELVYQAVWAHHFDMLAALLKEEGDTDYA